MGEAWELSRKSGALPDMREHKEKKPPLLQTL